MKKKKTSREDFYSVKSPPLTENELNKMRPVKEVFPDIPSFVKVRGAQKTPLKKQINIRLNPDVIKYFKSQGKGWQTKINDILTEYVSLNS